MSNSDNWTGGLAVASIGEQMRVYAIIDDRSSPEHPLGEAVEVFIRLEDTERFIDEVRGDEPELAIYLRIEERELERVG
jgi:hypothetical protein